MRHSGGALLRHTASRRLRSGRRGTILVIAMIALLIVTMLGAALLQTAVASLRQVHREQQILQAELLADAGCQRAVALLEESAEYRGDDWQVPAEQLKSASPAIVRIRVQKPEPGNMAFQVESIAEYPQSSPQSVRVTRKLVLRAKSFEAASSGVVPDVKPVP